jgi:hypothetical protein
MEVIENPNQQASVSLVKASQVENKKTTFLDVIPVPSGHPFIKNSNAKADESVFRQQLSFVMLIPVVKILLRHTTVLGERIDVSAVMA